MIVDPVGDRPEAIAAVLMSHAWDSAQAASAATGMAGAAFHVQGLSTSELQALVRYAGKLGLEVVTGEDWALFGGSNSRLGALARPWSVPSELGGLADALGRAMPAARETKWRARDHAISLDPWVIVGILNVTPDSFSDGGTLDSIDAVVARGRALLADGASILDVGGESTRPGRVELVSEAEECARIRPAVEALVAALPGIAISVDTMKAGVARVALDAGACIINDVTALRHDPGMAAAIAQSGAGLILMHSRGDALRLASYDAARYDVPKRDVSAELLDARNRALEAGISREQIVLDPGLGFGKRLEDNLAILRDLDTLNSDGHPIMVGPSRKRFLGDLTGRPTGARDVATAACCALAFERGASLFRVHNPAATRDALAVARSLTTAG